MVDIANFRFNDTGAAFDRGYARTNALRVDQARYSAGNALTGGDYGGAANALYGAGDLEMGAKVASVGQQRQLAARKVSDDRKAEVLKYTSDMAGRLSAILDQSKDDPDAVVGAFDSFFAGDLATHGETPEEIAQIRQHLAANPRQTVLALGAGAAKELGYEVQGSGEEVLVIDKATGKLVSRYRGARTTAVPEGGSLYEIPGNYGDMVAPTAPPAAPAPAASAPGLSPAPAAAPVKAPASALMSALIAQESGGDGNAVGPMTQYGQAFGSTQMLSGTAESMARKIGVPWRPDLMRGDTPAALAYQQKLGEAYLQEGLDKYGGDPRKGLMYYHGGPDESIWGPKTRAYAEAVLKRTSGDLGGGASDDALAGGDGEGGPRLLVTRPKSGPAQSRPATTEEKARYGIPDNVPAQMKPDGTIDVITLPKGTADSEKEAQGLQMQVLKARDIISTVDSVLKDVGYGEAGLVGSYAAKVPGTKAYDVSRQIETIKANLGFQELQAMRQASPTGGALGAIAVQELVALQSTVANLDIGQSEDQLEANLKKIKTHYQRWLNAVEGKTPTAPSPKAGAGAIRTVRTPEEARALPPGTKFRTPDGRVKVR